MAVQNEFAVKEEEMCALRNMSSQQIQKLQEDLQQVCDELTGKEAEFCSLTQIVEEQKNQAEVQTHEHSFLFPNPVHSPVVLHDSLPPSLPPSLSLTLGDVVRCSAKPEFSPREVHH